MLTYLFPLTSAYLVNLNRNAKDRNKHNQLDFVIWVLNMVDELLKLKWSTGVWKSSNLPGYVLRLVMKNNLSTFLIHLSQKMVRCTMIKTLLCQCRVYEACLIYLAKTTMKVYHQQIFTRWDMTALNCAPLKGIIEETLHKWWYKFNQWHYFSHHTWKHSEGPKYLAAFCIQ